MVPSAAHAIGSGRTHLAEFGWRLPGPARFSTRMTYSSMTVDDLNTPCLLVDLRRLDKNLERMQERAVKNNVRLRPHVKTHKSTELAIRQRDFGASGITVAKVGEAEVFARAGFNDIRIAYTVVGRRNFERICSLEPLAAISFCVDTPAGAQAASEFFSSAGRRARVLMEVDTGFGRCGVPWNRRESIDLAKYIQALEGISLVGILTHAGHSYSGPAREGESVAESVERVSSEERDRMLSLAADLQSAGLISGPSGFEISIGSTPSLSRFRNRVHKGFRITEIRPGNYVFNDAMQVALTCARLEDCALTVLSTVCSKHRNGSTDRLYLDAGKKILAGDVGFGTDGWGVILHSPRTMKPLPHARIVGLSEEHGWVTVAGGATLNIGDRVRIVPNHACVAVNLIDVMHLVEGEEVVGSWAVDARGKVA